MFVCSVECFCAFVVGVLCDLHLVFFVLCFCFFPVFCSFVFRFFFLVLDLFEFWCLVFGFGYNLKI